MVSQFRTLSITFCFTSCLFALLLITLGTATPTSAQSSGSTTPATITATQTVTQPLPVRAIEANLTATTTTTPSTPSTSSLGYLAFRDGAVAGGDFYLHFDNLPAAPAGGEYALWLRSPLTSTKLLTTFTAVDGAVDLSGTTALNLPLLFSEAQLTLEPLPALTNTRPLTISDRVVLTAQPITATVERLRPLLHLSGEIAPAEDEATVDPTQVGALSAAQRQVDIAVQHTGFLRNALSTDDIPQARRHAEHIINILDGKNGFMYGDLDRNGIAENPGDGVGVRVYLAAVKSALPTAADLFTAAEGEQEVEELLGKIDGGQTTITDMFDKALQIFASDTVTEANRFAGDLTALVDQLNAVVDEAHGDTLQLLRYSFYGPPQSVTLPSVALTVTSAVTPTTVVTESITLTPTRTIRLRPTATQTSTVVTNEPTRRPTSTPAARATSAPTPIPTPTAVPSPTPPPTLPTVESSALTDPAPGTQWRNPTDGAVYVYVPGGEFTMGADGADAVSPKEEPSHRVTVASFWLQQTETTNAQYARCVADGACTPPENERWDNPLFADHPVSHVSWQQAETYAAWAGGRLPTEAEWERACRADDGRIYPWGNDEPTAELANFNNAIGDTAPVGSYPAGQSAYGLLDLSGNLWEWTSSVEMAYPYNATDGRESADLAAGSRTVRGGSYYYTNYQIRCAARTGFPTDTANEHIGFRIVLAIGEE